MVYHRIRIFYLGESNVMFSSSDSCLVLKQGAISSANKSPWHPVCSATFRLTARGSLWMAHGDKADPLNNTARWIKSKRKKKLNRLNKSKENQFNLFVQKPDTESVFSNNSRTTRYLKNYEKVHSIPELVKNFIPL